MSTDTIMADGQDVMQGSPPPTYYWLCLDIETADGRPEEAERWARMEWAPNPNLKPDTIGRKYLEALDKKKERLALMDESPIIVVSLRSDSELRCLHCMGEQAPNMVHGGLVEGFADGRTMLIALRTLLDARCTPDTVLVGHNLIGFDMRKLRWAYLKAGLRFPCALSPDQPVCDTMLEYGRRFSLNRDVFISLDDLLETLGMESHKGVISGAQVPDLYRAGQRDLLVQYAMLDAITESEVFLRMTGQAISLS